MPTALATTHHQRSAKPADKLQSRPSSKKARNVRRRGRARKGLESDDDEIEREARTDSETDDHSSLLSDSDTASDDDDHPTNSFEVVTPSTTQSPPPLHVKDASTSSDVVSIKAPLLNGNSGPFVGAADWAQMVADEAAGGGDLPVIDFSDLNGHTIAQHIPTNGTRTKKKKKQQVKKEDPPKAAEPAPAPVADEAPAEPQAEPVASSSRPSSRERSLSAYARRQTPRQAYQQRLESDPSYVPTVGEFWGHDDRLLDKDLRSLSGWWRGRWQSRGRGRGGFSMRGRGGRGGFIPGRVPMNAENVGDEEPQGQGASDVPPIEREWTHDGFEEMKRREERRRLQFEQQRGEQAARATSPPQRGVAFRGRGGFVGARGRGGFARGGNPNPHPASGSRFSSAQEQRTGRVWYAMAPEKSWTKHHDYALYSDHALKPRPGQGPGYRVKLPGRISHIVRTPSKGNHFTAVSSDEQSSTVRPASTVAASEEGDRAFVVRIPGTVKRSTEPLPPPVLPLTPPAPATPEPTLADPTANLSIEEVFTVRLNGAPAHIPLVASEPSVASSAPAPVSPTAVTQVTSSYNDSPTPSLSHLPEPRAQQQLEQIFVSGSADATVNSQIEETVMRKAGPPPGLHAPVPQGPGEFRLPPPPLQPIQTSFSPVPQPSPPYGSPYTYGPLPPGVAMSHHGYPYEVATGRPVYLQPSPAPAMYTPRPMMHSHVPHHHSGSVSFIPGHMHHSSVASVSPDFLSPHSHSHSPPVNGFVDPVTGVPIFTPARQSSRIEIRAPGERAEVRQKAPPRPSGLRTAVSGSDTSPMSKIDSTSDAFAQSTDSLTSQEGHNISQDPLPGVDEYFQTQVGQAPTEAVSMAYPQYQQYYYPEQYGYPPYADHQMPSQAVHYDMYRQDPYAPHAPQPVPYY